MAAKTRVRNRSTWKLCFALAAVFAFTRGIYCRAESEYAIQIHLINGKTGKPISNKRILIFEGATQQDVDSLKHHVNARSDDKGEARVVVNDPKFRVWIDWYVLCEHSGANTIFDARETAYQGAASGNGCGIWRHNTTPGNLYIYARPESVWERMKE